ncbi:MULTISPECIES: L-aspartate oxidase [Pseudoalteromonas]|uniref:L-aspartate oxidase n=1 Tax=Pseudoalteromonas TaxID=53246 RepID=UPI000C7E18BD|nr:MULTISPECIES: L-aspartate oxidase [Pseudoalteromonas]AUJ70547.1 L-aspartate oxidase [Pseudoalteromonas sp. NC201]MCF2825556.1 L-aspartate oxidase [Pseudoalteromonas sp. OF5H-5]MCF2834353.1 L-aspartate oxidase [Pseudoalteromonas sp. DL2-H6]MCF2923065.1 L-aspartate oxidase [Pseudoalteromonas sp. DL2-H1]MCF7512670.1 L-aspartate oxidase [Pseudoalteromonas sp. L7]
MKNTTHHNTDVVIIGSGAAGLSLALSLANHCKVTVISKGALKEGSTLYAQGGIAAVFDKKNDSIESHVEDTLAAGAGLCDRDAVHYTASNAKNCLKWLIEQGVPFDMEVDSKGKERFHLTREGGHSHRRILHAADATGKAVQTTLISQVQLHPKINILEQYNAIDLIKDKYGDSSDIKGVYVYNRKADRVESISAKFVALATGGASKVYLYTSNPDVSSGDGIAMAWRAGCRVANMEFNQFHPTSLYHPELQNFLITEAMRGEGALLKRPDGTRFMPDFDEREELAPRDVVARAIDYEMKRLGANCVYLDISHKDKEFIIEHFPTIYAKCLSVGLDITKEPIPVVPAAHYTCGGVMTDFNGRTDIDNLYAIGEVAYTGLHGANRMASNSLLECIVFAHAAAKDILAKIDNRPEPSKLPDWDESRVSDSDEEVVITHNWHELRLFMWDYVGIVRSTKRLERALRRVELLQQEIHDYYANFRVSNNLLELRNLVQVAELIIRSALERKESRGLHYTIDFPDMAENSTPTVLSPTK